MRYVLEVLRAIVWWFGIVSVAGFIVVVLYVAWVSIRDRFAKWRCGYCEFQGKSAEVDRHMLIVHPDKMQAHEETGARQTE